MSLLYEYTSKEYRRKRRRRRTWIVLTLGLYWLVERYRVRRARWVMRILNRMEASR